MGCHVQLCAKQPADLPTDSWVSTTTQPRTLQIAKHFQYPDLPRAVDDRNRGIAMLHLLWRHCDEDTVEPRSEGIGTVFAATRCEAGEGGRVSQKDAAGPQRVRMGG